MSIAHERANAGSASCKQARKMPWQFGKWNLLAKQGIEPFVGKETDGGFQPPASRPTRPPPAGDVADLTGNKLQPPGMERSAQRYFASVFAVPARLDDRRLVAGAVEGAR